MPFEVRVSGYEEVPLPGAPVEVVRARALGKAAAVAETLNGPERRIVIGADTEVVGETGGVLGQPEDAEAARVMLRALAGRAHRVLTAVAVIGTATRCEVVESLVHLRALDEAAIDAYVARGEWRGRAGGYAIQETGGTLVETVVGDLDNVIGLPVATLVRLLEAEGYPLPIAGGKADTA
jgi:septum formation protein